MFKKKILLSVIILIIIAIFGIFIKIRSDINLMEKKMYYYLINSKGYKESDILSIKCEFSSLPKYPVYVTFKDEPNYTYLYSYSSSSDSWYQFPPQGKYDPQNYKHLEEK